MSTESNVDPGTTQNTPETAVTPEVATPEPEKTEAEAKPEATEDDRDKTLRRMERRINQKHAQAAAAEERARMAMERAQALEQRLTQYEAPQQAEQPKADPYELAREIAQIERITEKSNSVVRDGEKRFPGEFGEAVRTVSEEAGMLLDEKGKFTPIGEAIFDADDPAALLVHLGKNPDVAAELQGLSPAALGRRIGRIEASMAVKPNPVSRAPEPARPIGARSAAKSPESMTMEEFIAMRKAQKASWAR